MEVRLTKEQEDAVFAPVGENLVSAAAGSGKTKVLSERIVERLKSGDTSIDRLLIVTFTRAAALQMRERISKALEKEYKKTNDDKLKKQLSLVLGADICTIDSFCIDLVKKNFFLLDVPPDFNLAEENEMAILKEEIILDVLDEMYENGDEGFLKLANNFGNGKTDTSLKDIILKVYGFSISFADPEGWLDGAVRAHKAGDGENEELFEIISAEIGEELKDLYELLKSGFSYAEEVGIFSYADVFAKEMQLFEEYLKKDPKDINDGFDMFVFGSFAGKKVDESLAWDKAYLQGIHNDAKAFFAKIKELYELYKSPRGCSYEKIDALVKCVKLFGEKYMAEKLLRKELEFADCEYLALKALEKSQEICDELRDKYDEIYIDEYQDTNPLQDALFTLVSRKERGEANTFIVGDIKQSIYRFRHSDPMLFYEKTIMCEREDNARKMLLTKNFRSRAEVLDSINDVFEKIMRKGTAQVDYNEEHRLKHGRTFEQYDNNKSEIYIINSAGGDEDEDEVLAREQKESLIVAKRIREMVDEGFLVSDGDALRKIKYSDIAVLSSALKNKAEMITGIFDLCDVPVSSDNLKDFFDTLEIRMLISLLKAIDNPSDDIALASVMRSPIFMFDENEMLKIRLNGRNKAFYANVKDESLKDGEIAAKCRMLIEKLAEWREAAYINPIEKTVTDILDESGYYSFVGALPAGAARQENIRCFLDLAYKYESTSYKGLYNFIRYVEKTIETGGKIETGGEEKKDAVVLTTIHKSKGLEFPVVFVIGCGAKFNDKDASNPMIINPVGGIGIVERESDRRIKYKTAEYKAISLQILRESHAERMRLLYVAMTRAQEKLIMVGSVGDYSKKIDRWTMYSSGRRMSDYQIRGITNYLDYIMSSASREYWNVHVVDSMPEIVPKTDVEMKKIETRDKKIDVIEQLAYRYRFAGSENIPSKMSVSQIKRLSMEQEEGINFFASEKRGRVPFFAKDEKIVEPTARGTAYHRVLELINPNETCVKDALENFVQKGFMSREQADCIDVKKIEDFLKSPIAERMRKAKKVWKEASFTVEIDASAIFEASDGEKICMQGTIDCLIEEEDGKIILVDYKTDFYDDPEDIAKRYKKQLELYEIAVFKRFLKGCDEKYLYLLHKGDCVKVI